jgi:hypothetical protein
MGAGEDGLGRKEGGNKEQTVFSDTRPGRMGAEKGLIAKVNITFLR